jgi:hypothetical protein
MPAALMFGVLVDFLTFKSIRIESTFLILGVHMLIVALSIRLLYIRLGGRIQSVATLVAPFLLQFSLGALLSASLIFYWFSGSLSVSWPILLVIAILMVFNEVLRSWFLRPRVQIGAFYFAVFSVCTLVFPYFFHSVDTWTFLLSAVVSLGLMIGFLHHLSKHIRVFADCRRELTSTIVVIFVVMNTLYFSNIIPPIPLALRDAGVYHEVRRSGSGYVVRAQQQVWIDRLVPGQTIHADSVSIFASIFAPTDLNTTIVHHWEFFDTSVGRWVDRGRLAYQISGGRTDGYRGYSTKSVEPGRWRVSVETLRGQVIGRVRFTVDVPDSTIPTKSFTK